MRYVPVFTDPDLFTGQYRQHQKKTGRSPSSVAELPTYSAAALVTPAEVADTVLWLCGEGAGAIHRTGHRVAGRDLQRAVLSNLKTSLRAPRTIQPPENTSVDSFSLRSGNDNDTKGISRAHRIRSRCHGAVRPNRFLAGRWLDGRANRDVERPGRKSRLTSRAIANLLIFSAPAPFDDVGETIEVGQARAAIFFMRDVFEISGPLCQMDTIA